jgi:hypothetical protein
MTLAALGMVQYQIWHYEDHDDLKGGYSAFRMLCWGEL